MTRSLLLWAAVLFSAASPLHTQSLEVSRPVTSAAEIVERLDDKFIVRILQHQRELELTPMQVRQIGVVGQQLELKVRPLQDEIRRSSAQSHPKETAQEHVRCIRSTGGSLSTGAGCETEALPSAEAHPFQEKIKVHRKDALRNVLFVLTPVQRERSLNYIAPPVVAEAEAKADTSYRAKVRENVLKLQGKGMQQPLKPKSKH